MGSAYLQSFHGLPFQMTSRNAGGNAGEGLQDLVRQLTGAWALLFMGLFFYPPAWNAAQSFELFWKNLSYSEFPCDAQDILK